NVSTQQPSFLLDIPLLSIHPDLPIGGQLTHFALKWQMISSHPWILSTVSEGLHLQFRSKPIQLARPTANHHAVERETLDIEVQSMLNKQVIIE
ncbi:hypothetical protein H4S07_003738, partial [Coemansia furcata]